MNSNPLSHFPGSNELESIPDQNCYIYLQEIYTKEGFFGLFRGFHFRLLEIIVTHTLTNAVWKLFSGTNLSSLNELGTAVTFN